MEFQRVTVKKNDADEGVEVFVLVPKGMSQKDIWVALRDNEFELVPQEPVRFLSRYEPVDGVVHEERWEARPVMGLFRMQLRIEDDIRHEGDFFFGNHRSVEDAIAFVAERREIVDRSDQ